MRTIVLNVNRSRINALGFVMTFYVFALSIFISLGFRYELPPTWVFMPSMVAIVLGFTVTIVALLLLLLSQRLDEKGRAELWSFSAAELLTYISFSLMISGCLQFFIVAVGTSNHMISSSLLLDPSSKSDVFEWSATLNDWLQYTVGGVWFLIVYALPALFIWRMPANLKQKGVLAAGYIGALCLIFWISAMPYRIHARAHGSSFSATETFAYQFVQPLLWEAADAAVVSLQAGQPPQVPATTGE